jgi:chromosome segregation ATPase
MTPISAGDLSEPLDASSEVIGFLQRLSSMMAGGRNAEMLLAAANIIEALSGRLLGTEELYRQLQEEHSKSLELREVAELASDNLIAEIDVLKAHHADGRQQAEQQIASLRNQLDGNSKRAKTDRMAFAEETQRLQAMVAETEARLAGANASLEELREAAELASDNLIAEMDTVKAQHAVNQQQAEQEIASLKNQLDEHRERTKTDRMAFAEETLRLQAIAAEAEARLASANASLEELRNADTTIDASVAVVPIQSLQLARDQFDFLAKGFARSGDVISLTICEIGAQAIKKALADNATTD